MTATERLVATAYAHEMAKVAPEDRVLRGAESPAYLAAKSVARRCDVSPARVLQIVREAA